LFPCNIKRKAGRRIRTDDLLITNQLLYQLSYAGILRPERPPSAAISVLTVYAIFYGMPVGTMEHGHRAKRFKNMLSYLLRGAPPNNVLHQLYSLGRLRWLVVLTIIEAAA
jgi:hypothetical protein